MNFMAIKVKKIVSSGFGIDSYLKDGAFTAVKRKGYHLSMEGIQMGYLFQREKSCITEG